MNKTHNNIKSPTTIEAVVTFNTYICLTYKLFISVISKWNTKTFLFYSNTFSCFSYFLYQEEKWNIKPYFHLLVFCLAHELWILDLVFLALKNNNHVYRWLIVIFQILLNYPENDKHKGYVFHLGYVFLQFFLVEKIFKQNLHYFSSTSKLLLSHTP